LKELGLIDLCYPDSCIFYKKHHQIILFLERNLDYSFIGKFEGVPEKII